MMNEHRVYLPYVGAVLVVAALVARVLDAEGRPASDPRATGEPGSAAAARGPVVFAAAALVLVAHGAGTFVRNRAWRSEEALWADVVAKSPGNGRAWMNYGLTQMAVGRYAEALRLFQEAERLNPTYPHVHTNLGIVLDALGRPLEAEPQLRRAVELDPFFVEGHFYLARWLVKHGGGPEALDHARRATELSPGYEPSRALTMDLLYATGRKPELEQAARATLAVMPSHVQAAAYAAGAPPLPALDAPGLYNVGVAATSAGEPLAAAVAYRRSAELAPTGDAFNNLGWSLAQMGFVPDARAAYGEAMRVEPTNERARNNLALLDQQAPKR
jgi:Flp pilus assembly protein TadD